MPQAKKDIDDIWSYVALNDLPQKADALYDALENKFDSLSYIPERGRLVPELVSLGISDFYEIFYKPYRIIYKFINSSVIVYGIFDGRRDIKELLHKRFDICLVNL